MAATRDTSEDAFPDSPTDDVVGLLRLIRTDLRAGTRREPKSPSEEATIEALDRLLFLLIERSKLEPEKNQGQSS